jgi:NADH dehydrogenase
VVSFGKLNFSGFIGWWVWLFVHIGFLTGFRNRVGAILSWWFAFTRDLRRERTYTVREVGIVRDVYSASPGERPPGTPPGADGV